MGSLIVFLGFAAFAANGYCNNVFSTESTQAPLDGRPWPFGNEVNVPWKVLNGVWKVIDGSCENYFVFKFKIDQSGQRIITVVQYDPISCLSVARGAGIEQDRVIDAQMTDINNQSYFLTLHAFAAADVTPPNGNMSLQRFNIFDPEDLVIVLALSPVGHWGDHQTAYELERVSFTPTLVCQ